MAFSNVDGSLFKKMVINGAINLKNNYKEVDELNVFPVPDGDTGTNMSMTMMSGAREISALEDADLVSISKTFSRGLLMGARGNSGVILSQFFRGIHLALKSLDHPACSVNEFIDALVSGYQVAYKAVMTPVEGTILTVVREAGQEVEARRSEFKSIDGVMKAYIAKATESLANTPNLLPVLKEANVVDSGGAGFLKVAEGMALALKGTILELEDEKKTEEVKENEYTYCVEFVLKLNNKDSFLESDLSSPLALKGDKIFVRANGETCDVHIHTNTPDKVLGVALKHGTFLACKVENMNEGHNHIIDQTAKVEEAPVEKLKYALIAVCFGEGIKTTFEELGVHYIVDGGQTMNPSTEDFVKAIEAIPAENYIIIPNNSNIIMAAEQTAKICEDAQIRVLRTKTIAHGYASLMAFDENNSLDQNFEDMSAAIKAVSAGEVTYAVRDTEISGVKIANGDFMGILNGEIVVSVKERVDACKALVEKSLTEDSIVVTIFYGSDVEKEEVKLVSDYVKEMGPGVDVEVINGKQDIYSYIFCFE